MIYLVRDRAVALQWFEFIYAQRFVPSLLNNGSLFTQDDHLSIRNGAKHSPLCGTLDDEYSFLPPMR